LNCDVAGAADYAFGSNLPYGLRRLARKRNLAARVRQINPTGKSLLIFRNRVKPRNKKYSLFPKAKSAAHL
jgi:hypothetical protein